jgi:hypothetical protein
VRETKRDKGRYNNQETNTKQITITKSQSFKHVWSLVFVIWKLIGYCILSLGYFDANEDTRLILQTTLNSVRKAGQK